MRETTYLAESFADNCTEEEKTALRDFVERFLTAYIRYSSNADRNIENNFYALSSLIVPGSQLQARMRTAMEGLIWSNSYGDSLSGIDYGVIMKLGGGNYLCVLPAARSSPPRCSYRRSSPR